MCYPGAHSLRTARASRNPMPLLNWLQSLLPHKPSPAAHADAAQPPLEIAPTSLPHPDQSARIHIAANDPAFAAKREAAVAIICAAIDDAVTPAGYTRKGTTWARETPHGRTAINLQRSRYGFEAYLNLRFLTPEGTYPATGVWAQDDDIRIAHFYLSAEGTGPEKGVITYLDVHDDASSLDQPIHILKTRALPWLDAHHTAPVHPQIEDYLPR
jgi:Domain of unknown function (DUF4304)